LVREANEIKRKYFETKKKEVAIREYVDNEVNYFLKIKLNPCLATKEDATNQSDLARQKIHWRWIQSWHLILECESCNLIFFTCFINFFMEIALILQTNILSFLNTINM